MTKFFQFLFPTPKPKVDLVKEKKQISCIALGVLSITVFSLLAQVLLVMLLVPFMPSLIESPTFSIAVGSISMYLVAQPLSMLFFNRCEVNRLEKPRSLSFFNVLGLIAISMTLTMVGSILGNIVSELVAMLQDQTASNPVADATQATPLWAIILFMVIMAPVCEELLFRRVLIDRLRRYGEAPAILVSGLIFGVIHGNFSQLFYATLLGIFFGYIYVKTGKLRYTVFLHVFINFMGGAYPTIIERLFGGEIPTEFTPETVELYLIPILMMFALYGLYLLCFVGSVPSAIMFSRKLRGTTEPLVPLTRKQACKITLANVAVWASAAVLILMFVLNTVPMG